jgi:hypothetical protein
MSDSDAGNFNHPQLAATMAQAAAAAVSNMRVIN